VADFGKVGEVFEAVPSSVVVSLPHPDLPASQKLVVVTVFVAALQLRGTFVGIVREVGQDSSSAQDVVVSVDVAAAAFVLDVLDVADTFASAHVVGKRSDYTAHTVAHSRTAYSWVVAELADVGDLEGRDSSLFFAHAFQLLIQVSIQTATQTNEVETYSAALVAMLKVTERVVSDRIALEQGMLGLVRHALEERFLQDQENPLHPPTHPHRFLHSCPSSHSVLCVRAP